MHKSHHSTETDTETYFKLHERNLSGRARDPNFASLSTFTSSSFRWPGPGGSGYKLLACPSEYTGIEMCLLRQ